MKSEDLITYCGSYCGTCARWCEYPVFRDLATVLAEWVDAQGFHTWMPRSIKEFDYTEFRKALDFFSKKDTWLVCWKCCKGGGGRSTCEIRNCCKNYGLDVCFDCAEFPCDKVRGNVGIIERAEEYKKLSKDEWLRQQAEKAKQQFEAHTKKYYQIWAKDYPPIQNSDEK